MASESAPASRFLPAQVTTLTVFDNELVDGIVSELNHFLLNLPFGHGVLAYSNRSLDYDGPPVSKDALQEVNSTHSGIQSKGCLHL